MKEKFARFMYGRYGADQFSKFLLAVMFACVILNLFIPSSILYYLALLILIYSYYRMFSKNHSKRYRENQIYCTYKNRFTGFFKTRKKMMDYRKTHHIYSCPSCRQKIKIPKGKGKINITCPKCRNSFIKKS